MISSIAELLRRQFTLSTIIQISWLENRHKKINVSKVVSSWLSLTISVCDASRSRLNSMFLPPPNAAVLCTYKKVTTEKIAGVGSVHEITFTMLYKIYIYITPPYRWFSNVLWRVSSVDFVAMFLCTNSISKLCGCLWNMRSMSFIENSVLREFLRNLRNFRPYYKSKLELKSNSSENFAS